MDYYKSLHSTRQTFKHTPKKIYKSNTPQQMTTENQQSSNNILSTIKEGFAFGVGSSIANNTISRLFNSLSSSYETRNTQDMMCISKTHCDIKLRNYEECVRHNRDNCNELISEYEKCIRS